VGLPIDAYIVSWDEGYRSTGNFTQLTRIDAYDQNFFNLTGGVLSTGRTYRFQVSALNKVGAGPPSSEIEARAASLPGKPGRPERLASVLVAGAPPAASITIGWYQEDLFDTGGVPLTGWNLYVHQKIGTTTEVTRADATLAFDGSGQPGVTQFTVTGLELDQDYLFFVTALNPGEGAWSDALTLRAAGFPLAPSEITELAGSRTGSSIGLEWPVPDSGGSAILSYTLAVVHENEADQIVYYGSSTRAILEGLRAGEEYQFKIKATTMVGDSEWSERMFKFLIVDKPSPPLDLRGIAFDASFVSFEWQQPIMSGGQPLSGFKIYREDCSLAATTLDLLVTLPASQFQYTDATVVGGSDYKYSVAAYNQLGGESARSAEHPVTPINEPLPSAAPTLVVGGKDFITVEWRAPASDGGATVTRYILYVRAEFESVYQQVYTGIALTFRLSAEQFPALLRAGFQYQFRVRSVNAAGVSPLSPASDLMLAAVPPSAPLNPVLVSRSATSLKFKWGRPLDLGGVELLGYKVYVAAGNQPDEQVVGAPCTADPTLTYYEHTDLVAGQTYRLTVSAFNIVEEGPLSRLRTGQDLLGDTVDYVLAADLPEAPKNPPNVVTITETAISLTLEAIAAPRDGGSPVTGYLVEIDDGLGGGSELG
jgi:hypothetical protein